MSTAALPWLPYLEPHPWKPGEFIGRIVNDNPAFNLGGKFSIRPGGADFAGPDWRNVLAAGGAPDRPDADWASAHVQDPAGDKYQYIKVLYLRDGEYFKPVASYPIRLRSSWVEFRDDGLIPVASIVLAFGGGAFIAGAIGPALMGATFAAQYPVLTSAIGQVVLQTAVNGGNMADAVKGTVLSIGSGYAGAQVGATLSQALDSQYVAAAASAAVKAALTDRDIKEAVAMALLQQGANGVNLMQAAQPRLGDAWWSEPAAPQASADYFDPVYDPPSWWSVDFNPSADFSWSPSTPTVTSTPAPAPVSTDTGGAWIANLTNLALAAIKVNQAYQASKAPQPRTMTQAGGMQKTPNPDGTVSVRNPATGQVSLQRPEVGVPYVLADGRSIINNGDGTYSLILPDGSVQRRSYPTTPSGASSSGPPAWLTPTTAALAAGGLLLAWRLARR